LIYIGDLSFTLQGQIIDEKNFNDIGDEGKKTILIIIVMIHMSLEQFLQRERIVVLYVKLLILKIFRNE